MHDGEHVHVVECFKDLNGKALGEGHREALEVVILDELVQVYRQHFKPNAHMAPKSKIAFDSHNILLVFMIRVPQSFQDLDLNLTLLMQFLPILENLDSNRFFILVIKAFQNDTKCSSA